MSFGEHLIGNGDSYSLMYFFQPEFYDELEIEGYKEAFLAEKPYLRVHVNKTEDECKKSTNYDEDSIVERLKLGWSTKMIQNLYQIGNHTI